MVSRTEINAITITAEERVHQQYLKAREATREATREYCSTILSEQLKKEADRPSRCLEVLVSLPDKDREAHIVTKDTDNVSYYTPESKFYNVDTLVEFTKEHGFDVTMVDASYRYNRNTTYSCKKILIKW